MSTTGARISIDGGAINRCRDSLTLGVAAALVDSSDGAAWAWTLEAIPYGSNAVLTGPATAAAGLIPDVAGTYRFQLVIDAGANAADVITRSISVRLPLPAWVTLPAVPAWPASMRIPGYGEWDDFNALPNNAANTFGWAIELQRTMEQQVAHGFGLVVTNHLGTDVRGYRFCAVSTSPTAPAATVTRDTDEVTTFNVPDNGVNGWVMWGTEPPTAQSLVYAPAGVTQIVALPKASENLGTMFIIYPVAGWIRGDAAVGDTIVPLILGLPPAPSITYPLNHALYLIASTGNRWLAFWQN
jgi:hypothetical protein